MLLLKRAQLERSLQEEEARLRHIESRIAQIDRDGDIDAFDVVAKPVVATPFLSVNCLCDGMDQVARMLRLVAEEGARRIKPGLRDKLIVVARNDIDSEAFNLDVGFSLTRHSSASVRIADNLVLVAGELPAVETMATAVRSGTNADSHGAFGSIGRWIAANNYQIAGPCREVFLEPITGPPGLEGALVEIQFPIRKAA
jgi:effector-binding domain-containing protein